MKIAGAGVCHSDLHIIDEGTIPAGNIFTLGHENAGYIEATGPNVTGFKAGDAVLVYGPWGCGHCKPCLELSENYCDHQYIHFSRTEKVVAILERIAFCY